MNIDFNGFERRLLTFKVAGETCQKDIVKMSSNKTVSTCNAGDDFCGVLENRESDDCGAVQVTGSATCVYSGTAPTVGYCSLVSDGAHGVKVSSTGGRKHLVLNVNTAFRIVEFLL